jgi:hypothetical protein
MIVPTIATLAEISSESTAPAAANASVFAARKRSRFGAARSDDAIVRWRHSPLIPMTARIRMKKLLVSDVKTSVSTDSSVGSVSTLTRTAISSDVPTATPVIARNVRVVRSLSSSACSSAVMRRPP